MQTLLIVFSTLLALISPLIYAQAILKGNAKPHRTTRFILLLITTLATVSLFAQHDTVAIWLAGVSTLQSILIFVLSIKRGMGGWEKRDLLCLCIATLGIVLWQTTKNPVIALYASILADFMGMIPALIKTFHFPKTEVWTFYALDTAAAFLNLLAVKNFTLQAVSYPAYIMVINFAMILLIIRPEPIPPKERHT